jgi:octaprenyl-diphosphate synthase
VTASAFFRLTDSGVSAELLAEVAEEVGRVEEELQSQVGSAVRLVDNVGHHTLGAGGKRLRPAFVTLAAKASGQDFDTARTRKIGAAMEMIHMATLIHDDVIDHSPTRRGRPTASAVYGNTGSILAGDVLLAKSMVILAQDGDLRVIRTVSEMVVEMAEGEVRELEARGDFELAEREHLEILRMKTASFIQCCCEVGGMISGAEPDVQSSLSDYGYHVGMAFQLVDDLLDYRGDGLKTGKSAATDFREAQATLPLILLRPSLTEPETEFVSRKFGNGVTDDEVAMIARWMEDRGAFVGAEGAAKTHVECALSALAGLPGTASKELLRSVAEFVMARDR